MRNVERRTYVGCLRVEPGGEDASAVQPGPAKGRGGAAAGRAPAGTGARGARGTEIANRAVAVACCTPCSNGPSQQAAALIPGMHSPVAVRQQAISVAVDASA